MERPHFAYHPGEANDGIHRGAELVGHIGQELGFQLVSLFYLLVGHFSFTVGFFEFTGPFLDLFLQFDVQFGQFIGVAGPWSLILVFRSRTIWLNEEASSSTSSSD